VKFFFLENTKSAFKNRKKDLNLRKGPLANPPAFEDRSAKNRWTHKSQWRAIPRNPSHTVAKIAACAMEFGLKLWSSTP
jgi:hypothetical protein